MESSIAVLLYYVYSLLDIKRIAILIILSIIPSEPYREKKE